MALVKLGSVQSVTPVVSGYVNLATDCSTSILPVANGGSGSGSFTDGQLLIGNTTGNTLTKATLTGTANQITVTNGSGSITLATPQNIGTSSSPTFASLTATSLIDAPSWSHAGAMDVTPSAGNDFNVNIASGAYLHIVSTLGGGLKAERSTTSDAGASWINMTNGATKWVMGPLGDGTENWRAWNNVVGADAYSINSATNVMNITNLTLSNALPVSSGGTGQSSYTNGQLLIGNTTGNTLTKSTLTGTSNQVNVANGAGSITLSLPQNIHTGASPTFSAMTLTGALTAAGAQLGGATGAFSVFEARAAGGTQATISYDASNRLGISVNPVGQPSFNATGSQFSFNKGASLAGSVIVSASYAGFLSNQITNTSTNSAAYCGLSFKANDVTGVINCFGSTYTVPGTASTMAIYTQSAGASLVFGIASAEVMRISASKNWQYRAGSISPTLDAAAADIVSTAAVDNGAGNREFQCQPELGGYDAYGNDNYRRVPSATQDCQQAIKTVDTTDATQTTLHAIPITSGRTYFIESAIVARRTGGASGTAEDGASYVRRATYTTKSGTVMLMGSVQTIGTDAEDQAAWGVTFTVSGSNVLIRVTGASGNNVTWMSDTAIKSVAS